VSPLDLDPGRYGGYIWPAYAVTALVFAALVADTLLRARRWRRETERLQAQRQP
jgi:heme exporter protein D